jgi:hypothetical protein
MHEVKFILCNQLLMHSKLNTMDAPLAKQCVDYV